MRVWIPQSHHDWFTHLTYISQEFGSHWYNFRGKKEERERELSLSWIGYLYPANKVSGSANEASPAWSLRSPNSSISLHSSTIFVLCRESVRRLAIHLTDNSCVFWSRKRLLSVKTNPLSVRLYVLCLNYKSWDKYLLQELLFSLTESMKDCLLRPMNYFWPLVVLISSEMTDKRFGIKTGEVLICYCINLA